MKPVVDYLSSDDEETLKQREHIEDVIKIEKLKALEQSRLIEGLAKSKLMQMEFEI